MRMLDKHRINYEVLTYECKEFVSGLNMAVHTGAEISQSFKTLLMQGKSGNYYVYVVPIACEVDLKLAAKAAKEKSVEMIPVKEITKVSGYVRGGCSPLGMKKQFPTFVQESALNYNKIYISGGRIGTSICMDPRDLEKMIPMTYADFITK
ncbi:MAG: Cys-tRNA(Pro) deacylase [Eubacterium sp.]|nr:Cys-tRNA(Pro) deacylase [Eubacterium sp.]